jgi:hypothetical protein
VYGRLFQLAYFITFAARLNRSEAFLFSGAIATASCEMREAAFALASGTSIVAKLPTNSDRPYLKVIVQKPSRATTNGSDTTEDSLELLDGLWRNHQANFP